MPQSLLLAVGFSEPLLLLKHTHTHTAGMSTPRPSGGILLRPHLERRKLKKVRVYFF